MAFAASFNLAALNGRNGFVINGIDNNDQSGISVSNVGDVNGDGIDDVIIGADRLGSNARSYVVFGAKTLVRDDLNLASLDGSNGFVIDNINSSSINFVSNAGDINGDGIADLIIGAPFTDKSGKPSVGESYVVFGTKAGFGSSLNVSTLNGSNGFVINGIDEGDRLGSSVSNAGDVNGDGIDDLIIGAAGAAPNGNSGSGESYVVFGTRAGFNSALNVATLDGNNGFVINGINQNDFSGTSVSRAGDINGDGIDDLIIGATFAGLNGNSNVGESYVVFGKREKSPSINLSSLNGLNGFAIQGIRPNNFSANSVSNAGDVNGDGIDDLIIGTLQDSPNGNDSRGESYVIFGSKDGFSPNLNLANLNGQNGFSIQGIDSAFFAPSVSSAGDINGDGISDIIIGAVRAVQGINPSAGKSYVVFGSKQGFNASLDLASLNGTNGFVINGIDDGDLSGASVSSAGDINGDGIADLIIGAPLADPNGSSAAGESYVIFGMPTISLTASDLTAIEGGKAAQITISRGVASVGDLSVALALGGSASSSDYRFNTGTLRANALTVTIPDGQTSVAVEVMATDDALIEANETLALTVANDLEYSVSPTNNRSNLTLLSNDVPGFTLNKTTATVSETGTTDNVTVVLDAQPTSDVVLSITSSDIGEVTLNPTTLTFTAANWNQAQTVTLKGVDDTAVDLNQLSTVTVSVVDASSDDTFDALVDQTIAVTTTDNNPLGNMGTLPRRNQKGRRGDRIRGSNKADRLTGTNGKDVILGRNGRDKLKGGNSHDDIRGGKGNDKLFGGKGNDELRGGKGRDRLVGQQGNDRLVGGLGNDVLIGGPGRDTYVYQSLRDGQDSIRKFEVNKDVFDLTEIFKNPIFTGDNDFLRFINYVELAEVNGSTEVRVDADGSGSSTAMITLAVVEGQTGLSSTNFVLSA
ncbi:MAG: hypothetical protein AAGD25_03205 [Cyanobacteria bacterium P01_F01_bin.150]